MCGFLLGTALASLWQLTWLTVALVGGGSVFVWICAVSFSLRKFTLLIAAAVGITIGLGWFVFFDQLLDRTFMDVVNTTQVVRGVVAQTPTASGQWQRVVLSDAQNVSGRQHGKIQLQLPRYPTVHVGEVVRVQGAVLLPPKIDHFDYAAYLARNKIFVVMEQARVVTIEGERHLPWYWLYRLSARMEEVLAQQYSEPTASFLAGVLLGARRTVPADLQLAVQRTGTAHVLAVSGFNITILLVAIAKIGSGRLSRKTLFLFQGVAIVLFVLLTGATASAVRAGLMGLVVTGVRLGGRLVRPSVLLLVCAVFMVAANPRVLLFDLGFQLSFLAVIGLFLFSTISEKFFLWMPRRFGLQETITASLSAQIFTTPVIVWHFAIFSFSALPANLLVLPAIPLLMAGAAVTLVVGFIAPGVGQIGALPVELLSRLLIAVIVTVSNFSWSAIHLQQSTALWLAPLLGVMGCGLVLLLLWWSQRTTCFSCRRKVLWL